jgi:hypothetical protein
MAALIDKGALTGGDGTFDPDDGDRLSAPGRDRDYRLTDAGRAWMDDFGVKVAAGSRRPFIRYCVDWSEQRHHLAGAFGAALLTRLADMDWVRRSPTSRGPTSPTTAARVWPPPSASRRPDRQAKCSRDSARRLRGCPRIRAGRVGATQLSEPGTPPVPQDRVHDRVHRTVSELDGHPSEGHHLRLYVGHSGIAVLRELLVDPGRRADQAEGTHHERENVGGDVHQVAFSSTRPPSAAPVALGVTVAKPGDLTPFYDNTGISDDSAPSGANYDGGG